MEVVVQKANGETTGWIDNVKEFDTLDGELILSIDFGSDHVLKSKTFDGGAVITARE